jgi:hypothetical protein
MSNDATEHNPSGQPLGLRCNEELGPLPEPQPRPGPDRLCGYSAEQMHAYALQERAAERERWESAIGAVMPADFKQWRDSPGERPETAAWCIENSRRQEAIAWDHAAARFAELQEAVRSLAALNAWHHFGECRAWGAGPIISPHEADELARRVLRA